MSHVLTTEKVVSIRQEHYDYDDNDKEDDKQRDKDGCERSPTIILYSTQNVWFLCTGVRCYGVDWFLFGW